MPLPNAGGQQFTDANRNGYPDNFEAEEAALMQQIAQRKKMFGVKGGSTGVGYNPTTSLDPHIEALFGDGKDNPLRSSQNDAITYSRDTEIIHKKTVFDYLFDPHTKPKRKQSKKRW